MEIPAVAVATSQERPHVPKPRHRVQFHTSPHSSVFFPTEKNLFLDTLFPL